MKNKFAFWTVSLLLSLLAAAPASEAVQSQGPKFFFEKESQDLVLLNHDASLRLEAHFPFDAPQMTRTDDNAMLIKDRQSGSEYRFWIEEGASLLQLEITPGEQLEVPEDGKLLTPAFTLRYKHAEKIKLLGCDGLTSVEKERASYTFLAGADPETGAGVVAGWPLQARGSGLVQSSWVDDTLCIEGVLEFGRASWATALSASVDRFAIGLFNNTLDGLEAFAALAAEANGVELRTPAPSGYCTWYSSPHGGACDERHLLELAEFAAKELKPFGFDVVQIDDRWQSGRKRPKAVSGPRLGFLEVDPQGPYRQKGIANVAARITALGLRPGLWFIPFAGDPENPPLNAHPEFFVKNKAGDPYYNYWAGWSLDMSHAGARDYLSRVASQITQDWGCSYIKVDGLWSGMALKALYPDPAYKPDNIGDAYFSDPETTNLAAYRAGLRLLREASGDATFILGCNIAQNMRTLGGSFGLVDGMRVGRDIGAQWDHIIPCAELGSRLYFFHNRVWFNDPDCLMLREPLTLDQARAWASWIAVSGQMNLVSEWLPGLPAERLDLVKRSMPNHGLNARPLDLFVQAIPQKWRVQKGDRTLLAIFNWQENASAESTISKADIGDADAYAGYAQWADQPIDILTDAHHLTLPPASCEVFSFIPAAAPGVLSTSRHITQGLIDVAKAAWDAESGALSATSKLVGNDPYEVRLHTAGKHLAAVDLAQADKAAGVTVTLHAERGAFTLTSPNSRTVTWTASLQ